MTNKERKLFDKMEEYIRHITNIPSFFRCCECDKLESEISQLKSEVDQEQSQRLSAEEILQKHIPNFKFDGINYFTVKFIKGFEDNVSKSIIQAMHDFASQGQDERFILPEDGQVIEIAILFNDGIIDNEKLTNMVAMANFIIDRLYENGDISKRSSKELN